MRQFSVTAAIVLLSAATLFITGMAEGLLYDRVAILHGQLWRLLTGHLVHFSMLHWLYDISVFTFSAAMIEKNDRSTLLKLLFSLTISISLSLLFFKPEMHYYGGLSGVACGTLYFWALSLYKQSMWRLASLAVIFLVPIKIIVEMMNASSLLPYWQQTIYVPVPLSHLVGILVATVFFFYPILRNTFNKQKTKLLHPLQK